MTSRNGILLIIVAAQFFCTSLWFAGNGVMDNLLRDFQFDHGALGHLTSSVQLGFIAGTLLFALLTLADRFSPSRVFFVSALIGALFNMGLVLENNSTWSLLLFRFFTGFFLAGIYPVGMKIAADYFEKGLSLSLGYLVGALVLGTALPHFVKDSIGDLPWRMVIAITSGLALIGGLLILFLVPDGPFRKKSQKPDLTKFISVFKNRTFRSAAFGYFGHMWELYAFWAFVPVMLATYMSMHPETQYNISLLAFIIIGAGGIACVIGGYLARRYGPGPIAMLALFGSCLCCLLSPLAFSLLPAYGFLVFLVFWGLVVIADSPLFSSLVAHNADKAARGTALTIVNCVGFSITIVSIQLLTALQGRLDPAWLYMFLAIGPILGLLALRKGGLHLRNRDGDVHVDKTT